MVFDIEESKHLVQRADDFLTGKPLAITDGLDAISEYATGSQRTEGGKNYLKENREKAGRGGLKVNWNVDKLDPY